MSQQRKKYKPEYRREAANLVIESERPIPHVVKEIGVSTGILKNWSTSSANAEGHRMGCAQQISALKTLVYAET